HQTLDDFSGGDPVITVDAQPVAGADELRQISTEIPITFRRVDPKVGRNDDCPCGSGRKYKKCCGKE
ncbi:MAG: SEC-C metal-binding domain-containing protein, partial [Victivallaceae bacterium]